MCEMRTRVAVWCTKALCKYSRLGGAQLGHLNLSHYYPGWSHPFNRNRGPFDLERDIIISISGNAYISTINRDVLRRNVESATFNIQTHLVSLTEQPAAIYLSQSYSRLHLSAPHLCLASVLSNGLAATKPRRLPSRSKSIHWLIGSI